MPTGNIPSILVYSHIGYLFVYHLGLSLVHCSYLSVGCISKNNTLRSVRSVHLTHLTLKRKSRIRTQPPNYTSHLTHPDAVPNSQDGPDAAPNPQNAPDAAPNNQDAT